MDKELLKQLGLDPEKDLKSLLEDLEGKQYEYFERLETTNNESRREELSGLLAQIDEAIAGIKSQIASVDNAIIFDDGAAFVDPAEEEKQRKQEEKAQKKAKEAELSAKVQELKDKEEARRQEEEAAAAAAAQKPEAQPEADPAPAPAQQPVSDLQQGLLRYHKQNYAGAFPIFKALAEQNDATAQYMLACMYNRGEGTAQDHERAEFWMKKAADNGDKIAQFDYAIFLLADQGRDNAKTATGVSYLKKSADQGCQDAMVRYVELADKGVGDLEELKNARVYCTKLMPLMEDSYDKQRFVQMEQQLKVRQVKLQRRRFGRAASNVVSVLGALILMAATVMIFAAYHQNFLRTLPVIGQLPAPVQSLLFGYWNIGDQYIDLLQVKPMLILIALGWMLKGAGYKYNRNGFANFIVRLGCFLRYAAIVGHFALYFYVGTDMMLHAMPTLVGIAGAIVAGRILGWILGKILGTHRT